jgi:replicative DNA helicase
MIEKIASQVKPIRELLPILEETIKNRSSIPRFPFDTMPELSAKIHGLPEGLTVIGARTSQGKSAFATQIAFDLADNMHPTLFLSLEMTVENILERMFCNKEKVHNYAALCGKIKDSADYKIRWDSFVKHASMIPLLITEEIGKNFEEILLLLEHLRPTPEVIIIDYIQMVKQGRNEREMLQEYIRSFRQFCLEKKIAGVICSQLNRSSLGQDKGEDKNVPSLEYLKGTGALEEVADLCLLLSWEYFYTHDESKKTEYKIYVAKNRRGRTGEKTLFYLPQYYLFTESKDFAQNVYNTNMEIEHGLDIFD